MVDDVNFPEDFLASHDVHLILGDFNFDLLSKTSKQTGKSFLKSTLELLTYGETNDFIMILYQ